MNVHPTKAEEAPGNASNREAQLATSQNYRAMCDNFRLIDLLRFATELKLIRRLYQVHSNPWTRRQFICVGTGVAGTAAAAEVACLQPKPVWAWPRPVAP